MEIHWRREKGFRKKGLEKGERVQKERFGEGRKGSEGKVWRRENGQLKSGEGKGKN